MATQPKSVSATSNGFRFPMLATALELATRGLKKLPMGTWIAEEKYDGHRIIISVRNHQTVIGWSRTGLDTRESNRPLPKHLYRELALLPDGVYDGELIMPGGVSSDVANLDNSDKLQYVVFDLLDDDVLHEPSNAVVLWGWEDRRKALQKIFRYKIATPNVFLADYFPVSGWGEVQEAVGKIWERGGEGIILKRTDAPYQCGKRTKTLLKLKGLQPVITEVIGFVATQGEVMNRGRFATAVVKDAEGITTIVKTLDNDELDRLNKRFGTGISAVVIKHRLSAGRNVEMIVNHPDVGRKLVCEYTERTADGLYRHIRWDRWEDQ